uniref:Uncharacterized protein n=1 Tax=Megaselia scalaris TaxID=36166 RepID=T1GEM4_MEGSC
MMRSIKLQLLEPFRSTGSTSSWYSLTFVFLKSCLHRRSLLRLYRHILDNPSSSTLVLLSDVTSEPKSIYATHKGDLETCTMSNGKQVEILMKDVIFSKNFCMNLMSIKRLQANGLEVHFENSNCSTYILAGASPILGLVVEQQKSPLTAHHQILLFVFAYSSSHNFAENDRSSQRAVIVDVVRSNNCCLLFKSKSGSAPVHKSDPVLN